MSPDEFIVLIISIAIAATGWWQYYAATAQTWPPGRGKTNRFYLQLLPPLCTAIILFVLKTIAAFDVVGDGVYIFFYVMLGLAWLVVVREALYMGFDLSWRDDVVERDNRAALVAFAGALTGLTIVFSGGNVGDGPGWWVVVFTGGIATLLWFAVVGLVHWGTNVLERVTIDRDLPAAIRLAFFMIASGLILGRSAAGDWVSAGRTIVEFIYAWPVLVLAVLGVITERRHAEPVRYPDPLEVQVRRALTAGIMYLIVAVTAMSLFPALTQNPWYGGF